MTLRRVQVQGRDGSPYEFVLPEAALPHATNALRLRALGQPTMGIPSVLPYECNLQWFCSQGQDLSSFLIAWLDPESWLVFEIACRGGRAAIEESRCWESVTMGGRTLRFEADERKQAYVEHRRCVARVEKAFQDLRRFARFPDTVFNPGASLAETFAAEQLARVVFPDEVRASFVLFNGQARSVWLRSEGVIGGFELLSLEQSVELMAEEACFRGAWGQLEFVPLADRRNSSLWLAAAIDGGRICIMKPLSRPKVVAPSWSAYLRVQ